MGALPGSPALLWFFKPWIPRTAPRSSHYPPALGAPLVRITHSPPITYGRSSKIRPVHFRESQPIEIYFSLISRHLQKSIPGDPGGRLLPSVRRSRLRPLIFRTRSHQHACPETTRRPSAQRATLPRTRLPPPARPPRRKDSTRPPEQRSNALHCNR